MAQLDVDELIRASVGDTGLEDFGEEPFREALTVLVDALNDAEYEDRDRALAGERTSLLKALTTRLQMQDYVVRHPEIAEEELTAPVVIVGRQRTGTSKLLGFLAADPVWNTLPFWMADHLVPIEPDHPGDPDPRIALAKPIADMRTKEGHGHHHFVAEEPEMEALLLGQSFMFHQPARYIPTHHEWCLAADQGPAYRHLRRQLQFAQWQQGRSGGRWLLKTPGHLLNLPALIGAFPDARLVMTHRHPVESVASLLRVVEVGLEGKGQIVDPAAARDLWLHNQVVAMERFLEFRDGPEGYRFVDVAYRDVVDDSIGVARSIYDSVGAPFTDDTARRITEWEGEHPQHRGGRFRYRLEDYGLTPADIDALFHNYIERYASMF